MKINSRNIYQDIAKHMPEWPVWPNDVYSKWMNWGDFLGKDRILLPKTLMKEWHPTKNGKLIPNDVTKSSHKKVWWQCKNGHEWQSRISHRSDGSGCPYCCHNPRVNEENCLLYRKPDFAKEWHPVKNGRLTPAMIAPNYSKKVWWKCKNKHEWQATPNSRVSGNGCRYCAGQVASKLNNLEVCNPKLAKDWHPNKNEDLKPSNVTRSSGRKVWWQCKHRHEWQATVHNRNSGGNGCPQCRRLRRA